MAGPLGRRPDQRRRSDGALPALLDQRGHVGDSDDDGVTDPLDNCIHLATDERGDRDGDDIGDACDPFPDDPDNEIAQCGVDLAAALDREDAITEDLLRAQGDLAACQQVAADSDGDGEIDSRDRCSGTLPGAVIDDAGCSERQFCAAYDRQPAACRVADFRNDEPLGSAGDCEPRRTRTGMECRPAG